MDPHKASHATAAISAAEEPLGQVLDVPPKLGARVRLLAAGDVNKNDPNDARSVTVAVQRQHDAGSDVDAGLIPVTIPELLRLLRDIVIPPPPARQGAPAAPADLAAPPPAPRPRSSQTPERLCRDEPDHGSRTRVSHDSCRCS